MSRHQCPESRSIEYGTVGKPHGRWGEVRVHTDFGAVEEPVNAVLAGEDCTRSCHIESMRPHGDVVLVCIRGVDDRAAARELRGLILRLPEEVLPDLEEGTFFLEDLVDCRVISVEGEDLGVVTGLLEAGQNQVLRVSRDERDDWLLPAARAIIVEVCLDRGEIRVDPPEGLVDL